MAKMVLAYANEVGRHTVEALAADIAQLLLKETGVRGYGSGWKNRGLSGFSRSVGVEIERWNP
jgi:hypothetical protein